MDNLGGGGGGGGGAKGILPPPPLSNYTPPPLPTPMKSDARRHCTSILRRLNIIYIFYHFTNENNFCDFLFASLDDEIQSNFNGSNTFGTMKISSR